MRLSKSPPLGQERAPLVVIARGVWYSQLLISEAQSSAQSLFAGLAPCRLRLSAQVLRCTVVFGHDFCVDSLALARGDSASSSMLVYFQECQTRPKEDILTSSASSYLQLILIVQINAPESAFHLGEKNVVGFDFCSSCWRGKEPSVC
jgi:hypothetical protein